jgi:YD repeat-containing protein
MVIEKTDHTTTKFNVDDIQRVYFEDVQVPGTVDPTTTLTSKLKDKDGKAVYLDKVVDAEGHIITRYAYDTNGRLTAFQLNDNDTHVTYTTNGLNYSATYMSNKENVTSDIQVTLNDLGYIANLHSTQKFINPATGRLTQLVSSDYYFIYNGVMLQRMHQANLHVEYYNADGTVNRVINLVDPGHLGQNVSFVWPTGTGSNTIRQVVVSNSTINVGGFKALAMIGLFGMGASTLPANTTCTYNTNGTVKQEEITNGENITSYTYSYK